MVSIAILGNGVVGSGLVELIERNKKENEEENISITKILVRDKNKHKNKQIIFNNYRGYKRSYKGKCEYCCRGYRRNRTCL